MGWFSFFGSWRRRRSSAAAEAVPAPVHVLRNTSRPPPLPRTPRHDDAEDISRHVQLIEDDAASLVLHTSGARLARLGDARVTHPHPPPPPASKREPQISETNAPPSRRVLFHVRRGHWTADAQVLSPTCFARLRQFRDVLRASREPGCSVVRVISALQGRHGKAHCAAQLAFLLADEAKQNVLLVEADIDQPALHRVLDVQAPRGYGLSEQLKRLPPQAAPHVLRDFTRIRLSHSLDVLLEGGTGTPVAYDLPQFAALLAYCKLDYDYIVLNGPVVGQWPDMQAMQGISHFLCVTSSMQADEPDDEAAISRVLQGAASLGVVDLAPASDL
jgi:Mrp family chromosome partitioning ATPase